MRAACLNPLIAMLVLAIAPARADLVSHGAESLPALGNTQSVGGLAASPENASSRLSPVWLPPDCLGQADREPGAQPIEQSSASEPRARQLQPEPASDALCLSALAGLGLWQLGRSAKKLHLGALPDWYHTGGPVQVGHATPVDFEGNGAPLPVCIFELPTSSAKESASAWCCWLKPSVRFQSRLFLPFAVPRGPPIPDPS